jgi:hypothetical protein
MKLPLAQAVIGIASASFASAHTIFAQLTVDGKTYGDLTCCVLGWVTLTFSC